MSRLLFFLSFFSVLQSYGQYSDTLSCNGGTLQYAVHYNQQQCTAMCDGSYSIEILNGVGPYNYTITGPSYSHNNAIDSLLCPGAYSALVEDVGQGVSCTLNFNVDTLVPMTYSPGIIGETGTGSCDGVAWQSVSGGVPDYNYTWYDASYTPIPLETDSLMDTLCPGVYYVVVTDSPEGCVPSNSGFLQIAVPYSPIILTITSVVEEYCFMDCTAHFTYTVTGGSGVYNWEWNGSPYSMYNSTTSDIFCVPPYIGLSGSLEVWDDQGGYAVAFISWQGWPLEPWVQASPTDASCGNCDGTITFDDSYWNYYDYRLNSGPWQTSPVFTDLCPGTYEIEARLVPYHCLVNGGTIVVNSGAGSSNTGTDSQTTCDSYTWIDGNTYTSSNNTATHVLTNVSGCDSTVTLDLTITNSTTGTDSQTTCDSYTWIDGNTYTASNNTATHVLTNVSGCDSIVTLNLTINSNTGTDAQTACDSYTWIDGITYTSSNSSATWLLSNTAGCDSTVTLDLTITNSNTGTDTQTACDSYTWIDGNTYAASNNTATHLLTNAAGCDSTVTLDLTITNSNTGADTQTSCDFYTWIDGNTYTASNNTATHLLTNVSGCDSTVTLDLTITNSTTGTDTQTACDSYTWIDGNTYTASNNTATHLLTNVSGCDSTVTLDLTITNSNTGTDTQTACDSYTWIDGNTYTASNNTATHVLTNVSGCDSIVTLDLIINSVDTNVTQVDGVTLMSDAVGALYQWLDCGNGFAEILGETNQIFVAISNGNYAVEVSENNCIDTSACFSINVVGIYDDDFGNSITVLPNPTKDFVTINLDKLYSKVQIKIMDLQGKIISTDDYIQVSHFEFPILGGTGIYFLQIIAEGKGTIVRVVKTD